MTIIETKFISEIKVISFLKAICTAKSTKTIICFNFSQPNAEIFQQQQISLMEQSWLLNDLWLHSGKQGDKPCNLYPSHMIKYIFVLYL